LDSCDRCSCRGPTLRSMAANTAKRLHALTPRRIVMRFATLLSELGYDLILQVTTLSGLKN
ncbi:MAG: hypothetical protein QOD29_3268, partial [Alphaproteobacteria bacterium]|nr:hypothetical protein [Alphaproteobacteria bacterium]